MSESAESSQEVGVEAPVEETSGSDLRLTDVVRGIAAASLLGAAVIHFAYAPVHFDEATSHGVFFVAIGWLQLVLAIALAVRTRPSRSVLALTALSSAAIIGVWVLSRTAGVPGNEAEAVGFPDLLATGLEMLAVVAATALLFDLVADRAMSARPAFGAAGVGALATIVLVSMSVAPSIAGEHDHDEADGHSHDDAAAMDMTAGEHAAMDAAAGTDWVSNRKAALTGYLSGTELDRITQINREWLTTQILQRSRTLKDLPEAERNERVDTYVDWVLDNVLDAENGAHGGGHSHGAEPWVPLTNPADQLALQQQLDAAGALIAKFPTAADAMAAGYNQVSPWVPGIGAHYINPALIDDKFDPSQPEMLLYNGNDPTSELVGLSYAAFGREAPEGFVGPNDTWHFHPGLCMVGGLVVGPDQITKELCDSIGGRKLSGGDDGKLFMAHLWQVPGWESYLGIFSPENPQINLATTDVGR
ncbi:MAG TPA: hypothetical protein VGJ86_02465 [Acidimicrobiales bacterium]